LEISQNIIIMFIRMKARILYPQHKVTSYKKKTNNSIGLKYWITLKVYIG